MHRAPVETELKLLVPAASARRLAAHRLLQGRDRPRRMKLRAVYFDTPSLDLWRRGVALRVRREGRRWVQSVKGRGSARGGLHRRTESEAEVAGPAPEPARIRDRALAGALASRRLRARLKPVFTTDVLRRCNLVDFDGARVEASVDRGVIRSGRRAEPVSELELELKSGSPRRLYELALRLARDVPLSVGDRSKAERGYALARGEPAAPVKARRAALGRELCASDAFKAVMWAGLAHLQANERGVLEGRDPEYLHQMRVALRRLRSALGLFAPILPAAAVSPLRAELRWLAHRLGPARDWDVFATETLPAIEAACGRPAALRAFAARCERLRRAANARARRAVGSARYRRLGLRLAAWLSAQAWLAPAQPASRRALRAPVTRFAAAVLARCHRRVARRGRDLARRSPAELHRLRIAVKRLRYAADFFSGLFGGRAARAARERLAVLQDVLGAMNDAATLQRLAAQGLRGAPARRADEARRLMAGWRRARAASLRRELEGAWKRFRASGTYW